MKQLADTYILNIFQDVKNDLKDIIPYKHESNYVYVNKRTKALANCKVRRFGYNDRICQIEISKYATDMPKQEIKNLFAHELIHTCQDCQNHGYYFKLYMRKINKECPEYNVTEKYSGGDFNPPKRKSKYKLVCSDCGAVCYKNEVPDKILHHTLCGGQIKVYHIDN